MANLLNLSNEAAKVAADLYKDLITTYKLSPYAASAILGNVMQESTFDHSKVSSKGAKGVYLLLGDKYKKYSKKLKGNPDTPIAQLAFVLNELLNGVDDYYVTYDKMKEKLSNNWKEKTADNIGWYKNLNDSIFFVKNYEPREKAGTLPPRREDVVKLINTSTDLNALTENIMKYVERPSSSEAFLDKRISYANEIYNYFNPKKKQGGIMNYLYYFKLGGIHIKKLNRGKFTKSAKAAGESVQEHAHKVMNDPNATALQKKRANFAILAKKWHHKHEDGGTLSYLDFFNYDF